jgi:hypothetical protein
MAQPAAAQQGRDKYFFVYLKNQRVDNRINAHEKTIDFSFAVKKIL